MTTNIVSAQEQPIQIQSPTPVRLAAKTNTEPSPTSSGGDTVHLSPTARATVMHHQGMSVKQIASDLGLTAKTVNGYLGITSTTTNGSGAAAPSGAPAGTAPKAPAAEPSTGSSKAPAASGQSGSSAGQTARK